MSLVRDYTLRYIVDMSQASAGFAAVQQHFAAIQASAVQTAGAVNVVAQSFSHLAGAGNQATQGVQQHLNGVQAAANQVGQAVLMVTNRLNQMGATANRVGQNITVHAQGNQQSFLGLNASMATTFAAFQALQFGVQVLQDMAEKTREMRDHMKELGENTTKYRMELREIADMKGQDGPNDQVMGEVIGFGLKAAMKPEVANEYLRRFLDSNSTGEQKGNVGVEGMLPEELDKARDEIALAGARFGQRTGLDAKTSGDLTGILSQYGRVTGGVDASGKLGRVMHGLKIRGRGDINKMTRGFINTLGSLVDEGVGPIGSAEDMAVMYGMVTSHHNESAAGTYLKKAVHGLRSFGEHGAELEMMGITPEMNAVQSIGAAQKYLAQQKKDGISPDRALDDLGFRDRAEKQAIIEITKDWDLYEKRKQEQSKITGEGVQAEDAKFFSRNTVGMRMQAEAQAGAREHLTGKDQELVNIARLNALTRMKDQGRFGGKDKIVADQITDIVNLTSLTGEAESVKLRTDEEAIKWVVEAARNAGIDEEEIQQALTESSKAQLGTDENGNQVLQPDYDKTSMLFNRLAPQIQARGGDALGSKYAGVKLKVGEMATPASKKAERGTFRGPQLGPGVVGGVLGMAGTRTVTAPKPGVGGKPAPPPGQPLPPGVQLMQNGPDAGQGGAAAGGMDALLAELRTQTTILQQQSMGGPFGSHPDFGAGYSPGRA